MRLRISIFFGFTALLLLACANEKAVSTAPAASESASAEVKAAEADLAEKQAELEAKTMARDSILLAQTTEDKEDSEKMNTEATLEKSKEAVVEEKKQPKPKPRKKRAPGVMTFSEPVFNYGKIEQGDVVMHEFTFVNTGKSPLVINDIRASCGCTQPTYPFLPIAPGDKGVIGVKFDSKGKLGKMKPMVTITTNAEPAVNKIFLEGFVDAPSKKSESPAQDSSLIQ